MDESERAELEELRAKVESLRVLEDAWALLPEDARVAALAKRLDGKPTEELLASLPLYPAPPGWQESVIAKIDAQYSVPEPAPTPNDHTPVWLLVIQDMQARKDYGARSKSSGTSVLALVIADAHARDTFGRAKYGTPLQAFNGRDALVDAYQEALDLCVYLRQALSEKYDGIVWAYYMDALNSVVGIRELIDARPKPSPASGAASGG